MITSEIDQVLELFHEIHNPMSRTCRSEPIFDEDGDLIAVACVKNGEEVWRQSLAEILIDTIILERSRKRPGL